jgi:hypothetical protein
VSRQSINDSYRADDRRWKKIEWPRDLSKIALLVNLTGEKKRSVAQSRSGWGVVGTIEIMFGLSGESYPTSIVSTIARFAGWPLFYGIVASSRQTLGQSPLISSSISWAFYKEKGSCLGEKPLWSDPRFSHDELRDYSFLVLNRSSEHV